MKKWLRRIRGATGIGLKWAEEQPPEPGVGSTVGVRNQTRFVRSIPFSTPLPSSSSCG